MKSLILYNNGDLRLVERPSPRLSPNQCLIKIHKVGICSSDISRTCNNDAYHYPLVIGHEISGEIVKIGNNVNKLHSGQRVAVFPLLPCFQCKECISQNYSTCDNYSYYGSREDGGLSEYLAVNHWNCLVVPERLNPADTCLIEPIAVVINALSKVKNLNEKKHILVVGCGFLGLILCELLNKLYPFINVTIVDRNQNKLSILEKNKKNNCVLQINGEISKNTIPHDFFDSVFELTGVATNFPLCINYCKKRGEIVWVGNVNKDVTITKKQISNVLRKELNIQGTWNSRFKGKNDDWITAVRYLNEKVISPAEYITKIINLSDVPKTLKAMYDHKTRKIKLDYVKYVVDLNED